MTLIVGVTGFRQCGKDSTCRILTKEFGFEQLAFADPLREMAVAVDPVVSIAGAPGDVMSALHQLSGTGEYPPVCTAFRYNDILRIVGYERAKTIPDFRRLLQRLGTEGVRGTFGPNAWVEALALRVKRTAPTLLCISDVRFSSEADWILSQKGVIWRITRPGHGGDDLHASEVEIPTLPATKEIVADSLDKLNTQVIAAAQSLLGRSGPATSSAPGGRIPRS